MGYTLTLKRAAPGNSIYRTIADIAKIDVKDIVWFIRHDTPSIQNVSLVSEHILSKKDRLFIYFKKCYSKTC